MPESVRFIELRDSDGDPFLIRVEEIAQVAPHGLVDRAGRYAGQLDGTNVVLRGDGPIQVRTIHVQEDYANVRNLIMAGLGDPLIAISG